MFTIALILVYLSFYLMYSSSKQVKKYHEFNIQRRIQLNDTLTKSIAFGLLFTSFLLLQQLYGIVKSILLLLVMLMLMGSLITTLTPLRFFSFKAVSIIFLLLILIEQNLN